MEFFAFLLGVGLAAMLVSSFLKKLEQANKPIINCPPHKWTSDVQGILFCKQCNRRPGEIPTSYDKPY